MDEGKRISNKHFLEDVKEYSHDIYKWWKNEFGYSSNSKEYLTASEENVYEDYYDMLLSKHIEKFGSSAEALRLAQNISNPEFVKQEVENFKKALQNIEEIEI